MVFRLVKFGDNGVGVTAAGAGAPEVAGERLPFA